MTEAEAQTWIGERFGHSGVGRCRDIVRLVDAERQRQNLVSEASWSEVWARHIVDSAQLVELVPPASPWLDIGTGAGFPGLVAAVLTRRTTILVEPRQRRADFLRYCVAHLNLPDVTVVQRRVEQMSGTAAVISARAFARLAAVFAAGLHLITPQTVWVLPKGTGVEDEIAEARNGWSGEFHVKHSITSPDSRIVVAKGVSRR